MRKVFSFIILLATFSAAVCAQSARKVLDNTAARMTKTGGVKAQFKATQFSGMTPQSTTTGTMLMNGNSVQMTTEELLLWFDGKTQWCMMKNSY